MRYFAFVRRDGQRRYLASFPDFADVRVEAERLDALDATIRDALRARVGRGPWPAPTRLEQLPRQPEDHDGSWLMVEVGPAG